MRKPIKSMIFICGSLLILCFAFSFFYNLKKSVDSWFHLPKGIQKKDTEDFIKWVDFTVTKDALQDAYSYDVESHNSGANPINWISLLAYLGTMYNGDFSKYQNTDMKNLVTQLSHSSMETLTKDMKYYSYYHEAYDCVLGGLVGYFTEVSSPERKYGLTGFHPIAKGFPYESYDDFGASRSYGYQRNHLGNDLLGQIGTPIIAVESGYVEAMGWNQYGGWRIGIRSNDKKRYYYYAHMRKDFPYCKTLKEGDFVQSGDVIGYMGRTGYSTTQNVNNIQVSHLHFGLQLIFDESQKEGSNEIWVDCYELIQFLYQNQSETVRDAATKEWSRISDIEIKTESDKVK